MAISPQVKTVKEIKINVVSSNFLSSFMWCNNFCCFFNTFWVNLILLNFFKISWFFNATTHASCPRGPGLLNCWPWCGQKTAMVHHTVKFTGGGAHPPHYTKITIHLYLAQAVIKWSALMAQDETAVHNNLNFSRPVIEIKPKTHSYSIGIVLLHLLLTA